MKAEKIKKDIFKDLVESVRSNWDVLHQVKKGTASLSMDFIIKKPPKKHKDRDINNTLSQFHFKNLANDILLINYTENQQKQCRKLGQRFLQKGANITAISLEQILKMKETHKRKLKIMLKKNIVCCTIDDAPKLSKSLGKLISATKKTMNTYNTDKAMSEFMEPLFVKKQTKIQNNRLQLKVGDLHKDDLETIVDRIKEISEFFINKQAEVEAVYYKTTQRKAIEVRLK